MNEDKRQNPSLGWWIALLAILTLLLAVGLAIYLRMSVSLDRPSRQTTLGFLQTPLSYVCVMRGIQRAEGLPARASKW